MRSSIDRDPEDKSYDSGDRKAVAEKEKSHKQIEIRRLNGLRQLMSNADGRLWMWNFLSQCGLFAVAFNGNSRDYFNLGMRNAGMPIFTEIQTHFMPEYLLMAEENRNV